LAVATVAVGGGLVAALVGAGVASAGSDEFLADLAQAGFGEYSADEALAMGHAVCAAEAQGATHAGAVDAVYDATTEDIGPGAANFFVESAEMFLC
jgi:hypothetical protein